jgi:hypothetical protein
MVDNLAQADPHLFYKFMKTAQAEKIWILSVDLGIYEALQEGPMTIKDLSRRVGIQHRPASMVLAINNWLGILGKSDGRYFIHDVMCDYVLKDGKAFWNPKIPEPGDNDFYDACKQAVLTNEPQESWAPPWLANPEGSEGVTAFGLHRHGQRTLWGESLADAYDFSRHRLIVDLGGASGGVMVGLTSRYLDLKAVVVDLPYGKETAERAIEADGASDRVSVVAADFFKDPLPEGDVYLLSHILHDWDEERCDLILRRCLEKLPSSCPVIVYEYTLNEEKNGPLMGVVAWVSLVMATTGDQRTPAENTALLARAGFEGMETRQVDEALSIVVGYKP